jgi:hypothetical protein
VSQLARASDIAPQQNIRFRIATVGEERLASNLGINYFAYYRSNLLNNIYAGTASESLAKVLELRAVP